MSFERITPGTTPPNRPLWHPLVAVIMWLDCKVRQEEAEAVESPARAEDYVEKKKELKNGEEPRPLDQSPPPPIHTRTST